MPTPTPEPQHRHQVRIYACAVLAALLMVLASSEGTSQAIANTTHCSGSVYSHSGGTTYKVTNLSVNQTTCALGKKLSSKIPAYRVPKPLQVEGFRCTSKLHYSNPQSPIYGGFEDYVCRKQSG